MKDSLHGISSCPQHTLFPHVSNFLLKLFTHTLHGYIIWLREHAQGGGTGKFMLLGASCNQWHMETRWLIVLVLFQLTLAAIGLQLCFTVIPLASKCIIWMGTFNSCITVLMLVWYVEKEQFWKGNKVEVLILSHISANQKQYSVVGGI